MPWLPSWPTAVARRCGPVRAAARQPRTWHRRRTSARPRRPSSNRPRSTESVARARSAHRHRRADGTSTPASAFDNAKDEGLGLALVSALDRSSARSSVRAEVLRPPLANYPESVRKAGEALLASVNVDLVEARRSASRTSLLAVQGGDVARGQAVFNSPKAACLTCHAIGYLGGKVGPDLTRIGQVRSERDLLEAVSFRVRASRVATNPSSSG